MRRPRYESSAPKQTVSVTLNSDLYAKAKSLGINASRVAEQALADAYAARADELLKAQIAEELQALDAFAEAHGSFPALAREHKRRVDEAV
jgi:post-segregation antitoxin (ccd killing protein)